MGKDNLILGTARGKLGDVVFYRTGGEQRFRTRVRPTNPQTNAQLLQRAVVSTAVKAYSDFVMVCDHAFQNFEGKMKNQQRFMRLNIKWLREVALSNVKSFSPIQFTTMNDGNYVVKDAGYTVLNPWQISEGDLPAVTPFFENVTGANNLAFITASSKNFSDLSYQEFAELLGVNVGDQLTFIMQYADNKAIVDKTFFARIILMPASNNPAEKMFTFGENGEMHVNNPNKENYGNVSFFKITQDTDNYLQFRPEASADTYLLQKAVGIITSRFENNMWRRSTSFMVVKDGYEGIQTLRTAMESYLKYTTSSLYLNQATNQETLDVAEDYKEIEEEITEKTTEKQQKSKK